MGVQNLWQILAPVKSEASVESLKGKKIAVDLAIWLVESQVTGMKMMQGRVVKPHLRNLFFRVSNFLRLGVKLVFVIDGTPPELKWEEMARRNEARLGGGEGGGGGWRGRGRGRGGRGGGVKKASRSHFACWLKECQELLELMGVPCIQSKGEAEAMCAALNSSGIVDGCMTEDGDAFLYGARVVYRNLNMATGQVDCYSMDDIETDLNLDRRRLVALAILLGCDYLPKGVPGIGKEVAIQFMNSLPSSVDPLKLFEDWSRGCDSTCSTNVERDVRKKSLRVEGFPNQDVIKEFLDNKERPPAHHTEWRRPLLQHLQQFNLVKMEWPHEYTQEKVIPLVTLYDLTHMTSDPRGCLHPAGIVKLRVRQGVQCVEVKWHKPDEDKENDEDADPYYTTVEKRALFTSAYPDMMEQFLVAMETKKTRGQGKKKKEPSSSLQQGRATDEGQLSADGVMVLLENEQPYDFSPPLSQEESYDRGRSKLRNRDLGLDYETADGKSKFAVERYRSGDTDDEGMLMKLINLSLHDSKTQESMEGRGEPQGNRAAIADAGRRQKRTQDRDRRTKPGRNCLKGKETRLGKQPPAEGALEELSTLKTTSLPVVPAVIMKSQSRKQAIKEIQQLSNDKNTEKREEEEEEEEEAGEEESFMEVLPLSQRLGCHSLRGFVPSSRITGNHCSSSVSSNAAKSASHLSSDSESDLEIPETSPLSCDEEILEINPVEIRPLEFSLADSNKEIERARYSSKAHARFEQFPDEESPETVPEETTFVDLTLADVDKEVEVTNHAPGTHAESKWLHVDSPCDHSGRRSQEGHMDQKLFTVKEMAETTSKLEIVQTLDLQLDSPPAGNQDTQISVVHPSCHKLTTATHEVIDLTEDSPLDDKYIATVHSVEQAAIHQSPSAVASDVPSRSLDEKKNDDDEGRPDRGRLDKISSNQESSKFSSGKNVSSFMKLDGSLAKFMDELSLVSYSTSAAASFTESDDSVFIVEDGEPWSDERAHIDEKNEEKEEKCVSSCEGTVERRSLGIQELFPSSEALDKICMVPEEKVNDTAVKSEPTVQGDLQDGTEHHRKEPMNVHMISDCKTNSKLDCLFVTKQAIDVKLEDGELCRKKTNNIDKETLDCVMTATFNSVEASERPSCKPQLHKEVPLSSILHKQMENLSPPVLLRKKKVKPKRGHVSKAKKRHKMMKSSSLHDSVLMENDLMKILQTMSPLSILPNSVSQETTSSLSGTALQREDPSSQLLWSASKEGRPCSEPVCFSPSVPSPSETASSCSSSTSASTLLVTPNLPKSDLTASLVPKVPCATLADSVAGLHVSPCTNASHLRRAQLLSMLSQLTPGDSPLMDLKVFEKPQKFVRNYVEHQDLNSEGNQPTHLDSVDTDSVPCRDILGQSIQQHHVREPIHNEIDCGCKCITSKSKVHVQGQNCLPNVCVGHKSEVSIQETQLQGTRNVPKSKSLDKPKLMPKPRSLSQPTRLVKRNKGSRHTSCSQPAGSHTTSRSRSRSKSSVKHFQRRESVLEMECGLAKILEGIVTE